MGIYVCMYVHKYTYYTLIHVWIHVCMYMYICYMNDCLGMYTVDI